MSCKIKRKISNKEKIQKAVSLYENVLIEQKNTITEDFISNCGYVKLHGTMTENAVDSYRTRDMVCISLKKMPHVVLYEESLYNLPTLNTKETVNKILNDCNLTEDNTQEVYHYNDQVIADYVCFYLPASWGEDTNNIAKAIEKTMTACGYFQAINPEIMRNDDTGIIEYIIQYEPNHPDWRKVFLPDMLHHATTIQNAEKIKEDGLIPKVNDVYKYSPRIYFAGIYDDILGLHLARRHGNEIYNPKTNSIEYIDIIIKTPADIKFYIDYHMPTIRSYFTFDKVDKKYITNMEIKHFYNMMDLLHATNH